MRRILFAATSAFVSPAVVHAQASADSAGPRAHSWGVEGIFAGGAGGRALYFPSRTFGVVAAVDVNSVRGTSEVSGPFAPQSDHVAVDGFAASLGARWLNRPGATVRPFEGLGAGLSYQHQTSGYASTQLAPSAYGEIGASVFVVPHVSLNGSAQVAVTRNHGESNGGSAKTTSWYTRAHVAQLSLSIYF